MLCGRVQDRSGTALCATKVTHTSRSNYIVAKQYIADVKLPFRQRINAYIENQDFCEDTFGYDPSSGITWRKDNPTWPPLSSLVVSDYQTILL